LETDDFVDSVSGTNGLAGAADTIIYLQRDRHSLDGVLSVTGRDVTENEYAITLHDGVLWQLSGGTLETSRAQAGQVRDEVRTANLGPDMQSILDHLRDNPSGARAADVASATGIDKGKAAAYLKRLADNGHIHRLERGLYVTKGLLSWGM